MRDEDIFQYSLGREAKPLTISKAIANLRIRHKISQEDLAAVLCVSRDLVSKWETGSRRPDWQMIERIAKFFSVPTDVIVDKNELVYKELEKCLPKNSKLTSTELVTALNSFLHSLDENEADMFIHRYYFFESVAEIAASFHMKENHLRTTLSRTRQKLKKYIKEISDENIKNV